MARLAIVGRVLALLVLSRASAQARGNNPSRDFNSQSAESAATTQPAESEAASSDADSANAARGFMHLDELTFDLGFEAEYHRRRTRSSTSGWYPGRFSQLNETRRFEETAGVRAAGDVWHDRFLRYDVFARYGLSQEAFFERRPGPDLRDRPEGDVLEYDVRFDFLPAGKISGTAYASQLDDRIPRQFLPSLERRRERYGAGLFFNDPKLPMRLTFDHLFEQLESATRYLLDDEDRGEDTVRYEATWQPTEHHSLRLDYEYKDIEERYSGSDFRFDSTRNYLTLDHALLFGRDRRSRLDTLARFQDETGELGRDSYEFGPQLRLQHTDSLATFYKGQFLADRFQQLETRQYRGDIGLIHELKLNNGREAGEPPGSQSHAGSLVSTVDLFGLHQDYEDGDVRGLERLLTGFSSGDVWRREPGGASTEWGGSANFAFSRENRLGRLSSHLSYAHTAVHTSDGRRGGIVIAEAVTFRDPLAVYLSRQNVDRYSIVVMDGARRRVFLPGRDYTIVRIGAYAALYRVRTGRIADRETVFVTYTYRTFDSYELSRDRIDFRIQQDLFQKSQAGTLNPEPRDRSATQPSAGSSASEEDYPADRSAPRGSHSELAEFWQVGRGVLSPYYAASFQDEDVDGSGFLSWRPRNVNRHRLGAAYRQPRWSGGAEYEYHDDAIDPYDAVHLNGDIVLLDRGQHQVSARTSLSRFWYDGEGSSVWTGDGVFGYDPFASRVLDAAYSAFNAGRPSWSFPLWYGGAGGLPEHDTTFFDAGLTWRALLSRSLEAHASAAYRFEKDSIYGRTHGVDLRGSVNYRIGLFTVLFEVEYEVLDIRDSSDKNFAVWLKLRREIPVIGGGRS